MHGNKAPNPPLRVLILEDDPADAELVERELRRAGIAFSAQRTDGKSGFAKALRESAPQVILSDFNLPGFDGMAALRTARELSPDVPFIFVSGSIGEEKAIETLGLGAADYIFKDNLARLGPAVKRVLAAGELLRQKQAMEEALRESARMYATLVANLPGFVYRCANDREWTMEYISEGCREITGYGPEDFIHNRNLSFNDIIHPDHRQALWEGYQMNLEQRRTFEEEYRIITACGEVRWVWERGQGVYAGDGTLLFLEGFITDVTQRRTMQDQLRQSEEYYRTLVDTSPDAIIIVDAGGRVTFASQRTFETFGIPPQTVMTGISILDFVEPGEIPRVQERMVEILTGRSQTGITVYRLLRHDRRPFWGEVSSSPLRDAAGRSIALLLVCRDVSERKRADERLSYQAGLLQDVSDAIIATDEMGAIRVWNRAAERIYGWKEADVVGKLFHDVIDPEYPGAERRQVKESLDVSGYWSGEIVHRLRDGKRIPVRSTITRLADAAGNPAGMVSVNYDISERKQAEEMLRESDRLLQNLAAQIPGMIYTFLRRPDGTYSIPFSSHVIRDIFGVSPQDVSEDAAPVFAAILAEDRARVQASIERSGRDLTTWLDEYRVQLPGQPVRWMWGKSQPYRLPGGSILWYGFNAEITERKRAEEIHNIQYRIASAMATVENLEEFFTIVRAELNAVIDTTNFLIVLYDEARGMLSAPFERDEKDAIAEWPAEKSLTGMVIRERRPVLLNKEQIRKMDEAGATQPIGAEPESWLGVPLSIGERVLGAIVVQSYTDAGAYDQGNVAIMEIIARQMSVYIERKRAEEQIKVSLKEKEVLLKEIHHRVKNNLQIISGLLTLQSDQAAAKPVREIFQESQDRIRSIALIHEKLYGSHNLSEIAFDDYLRALVGNLLVSHSIAAGLIGAAYDMERVFFTIEKAIPLGLIVNELVTNSIKHAFPGGRGGWIRIGLRQGNSSHWTGVKSDSGSLYQVPTIELTIADDGVGLPKGFALYEQKTLGMHLVGMLVKQLQAEVHVGAGAGSEFRIVIPAEHKKTQE